MQKEFEYIKNYINGKGIDIGCGTNRLSNDILAIDQQPNKQYAHADIIHDCKDLNINSFEWKGNIYSFIDNSFDFIFSSHCLEDFKNIPEVFLNWWKKIKKDGYMILLLPDIEGGRYPKCDNKHGNPSHRTDVGKNYIMDMLIELKNKNGIDYDVIQSDTIPHDKSCSIDFVIKKKE